MPNALIIDSHEVGTGYTDFEADMLRAVARELVLTRPLEDLRALVREWVAQTLGRHPSLRPSAGNVAVFEASASQWREDARLLSSPVAIAMHPAYQRIIGLGPAAIPLILGELQRGADHWFWALRAISRHDAAAGASTVEDARQAWLRWGRANGHI